MPYEVAPLTLTPQKAERILSELIKHETLFNDYQPGCPDHCGICKKCVKRKTVCARNLTAPDALVWEVWKDDDLVGILNLTDVVPGHDALAHFAFFDSDLRGKSAIINRVLERACFGELGLHRVSTEIPAPMRALRLFVVRKLGFTEEGTKREAVLWDGKWEDVVIYGRLTET